MLSHRQTGSPWLAVARLAASQDGVVTRAQWLAVGLDRTQVQRRVRAGAWLRMLRGVYLVQPGPGTRRQWQRAALLYAGPDAQLTGVSSLALHGLRYLPDDERVHVLVPASTHKSGDEVVTVHRARTLPPPRSRGGLVCSPPDYAALLACRELVSLREVRALLSEVVQRRLTTVDRLQAVLAAGPSAGSALPRRVLGELAAGCRSAPECEVRDLVMGVARLRHGMVVNHRIVVGGRVYLADVCWPHLRLIIEVDSVEHHGLGDGPEYTARRRAALVADGWTVLSVSPRRVREDGLALLAEVEAVHARLTAASRW